MSKDEMLPPDSATWESILQLDQVGAGACSKFSDSLAPGNRWRQSFFLVLSRPFFCKLLGAAGGIVVVGLGLFAAYGDDGLVADSNRR